MTSRLITLWDSLQSCPFPDSALRALVAGLPPDSVLALGPDQPDGSGMTAELQLDRLPANAPRHPRRRAQYGMGRHLARTALETLGVEPGDLGAHPDGGCAWPPRIVGSITHTRDVAAAWVGPDSGLRGLGIDAERHKPLSPAAQQHVLTPAEIDADDLPPALRFSAKEAIYKCLAPLGVAPLRFQDVSVGVEEGSLRFEPTPDCQWKAEMPTLAGVCLTTDAHVLTCVWARTPEPAA